QPLRVSVTPAIPIRVGANQSLNRFRGIIHVAASEESLMPTIWQDLRYGARALLKNPGFALIVIVTLAMGIGSNAAIYTRVNAALLRGLPYREPDRLVHFWGIPPHKEFPRPGGR